MRTPRISKSSTSGGTMVSTMPQSKPMGTSSTEMYGAHQVEDGVLFVAYSPQASKVQIAGDFNSWQPDKTQMRRNDDGSWQVKLRLSKGVYRYRLVVDGKWQQDPHNKITEPNPYGELNSVIRVN